MKSNTQKVLGTVFGILFYGLGVPFFYVLCVLGMLLSNMIRFSNLLFAVCFLLLPLLALLTPVAMKFIFKKPFYQSVLFGVAAAVLSLCILFGASLGIEGYMSDFTVEKWGNEDYTELRYLMIDDLEQEYDLIGMDKEEVIDLLGDEGDYDRTLRYEVQRGWLDQEFFCLSYDENGKITSTYMEQVD